MSGGSGEIEFLSGGPEREPRRPRRRLVGWWRPSPIATVVLLILVIVVAGVVWFGYAITAPQIPSLRVTQPPVDQATAGGERPPWQPSSDGQPAHGVELAVHAVISTLNTSGGRVTVLGMPGPGVVGTASHPIVLAAAHATPAVLIADLDCSQVRLPVNAADYRIRLQVVGGSRTTIGSIEGGGISASWASSVELACGSWLARRDLTVVQASATVNTHRAGVDLAIMIDNKDRLPAFIGLGWNQGALTVTAPSPGETVLAAGKTSTLHLHVGIENCESVPPPFGAAGGDFATSADYLGVAALVGSRPQGPTLDANPPLDGIGPTGIIIAPGPRTAIEQALRSACANLDPFVTLIANHGMSLDTRTGVMTVRISIDGTPGKVRGVLLLSDPAPRDDTAYQPLWMTPTLVPDRSGQVIAMLRYRVPANSRGACPSQGAWIPGFTLIAYVPVGDHVETLRYSQYFDPSQDPGAINELCPSGAPIP